MSDSQAKGQVQTTDPKPGNQGNPLKLRRLILCFLGTLALYFTWQIISISRYGFRDDGQNADCAIVLGGAAWHNKPSPRIPGTPQPRHQPLPGGPCHGARADRRKRRGRILLRRRSRSRLLPCTGHPGRGALRGRQFPHHHPEPEGSQENPGPAGLLKCPHRERSLASQARGSDSPQAGDRSLPLRHNYFTIRVAEGPHKFHPARTLPLSPLPALQSLVAAAEEWRGPNPNPPVQVSEAGRKKNQ